MIADIVLCDVARLIDATNCSDDPIFQLALGTLKAIADAASPVTAAVFA